MKLELIRLTEKSMRNMKLAAYVLYTLNVILSILFFFWDFVFVSTAFKVVFWSMLAIFNGIMLYGLLLRQNRVDVVLFSVLPIIYLFAFFAEGFALVFWLLFIVLLFLVFFKKQHIVAKFTCCCIGVFMLSIGSVLCFFSLAPLPVKYAYYPNSSGKYTIIISYIDLGGIGSSRSVQIGYKIISNQLYLAKSLHRDVFPDVGPDTKVVWLDDRTCLIGRYRMTF